jgi:DNA-binding IclR family transcriptional regulator
VFDQRRVLAQGAKSTEVLARETGTDASALRRLLRALARLGVVDELESGVFRSTAAYRSSGASAQRGMGVTALISSCEN